MIDFARLIKETVAYKIFLRQKKTGGFSHAYLIECADGDFLKEYLKIFAKAIMCDGISPCGNCRAEKMIEENIHPDVIFLPKNEEEKDGISVDDINYLIEESYLMPIEGEKKIFIINHAEKMTGSAQNKLLKTLEEPPKNVYILMGATSLFPVLPTIRSRAEKLEITGFDGDKIVEVLKEDCKDEDKLYSAVRCGDGTLGDTIRLYNDEKLSELIDLGTDLIVNMQSSKNVLEFSVKIAEKESTAEFFSVLETLFKDLLCYYSGREDLAKNKSALSVTKTAKGYNLGSVVYALEKLNERNKREKFNSNQNMLLEWILFAILEGKFKWQKS